MEMIPGRYGLFCKRTCLPVFPGRVRRLIMEIKEMLLQVQRGTITVEEAEAELKDLPFKDLGYAKLDYHRKLRSGFPETVFCQGKPDEYLGRIFKELYERNGEVMGTRASAEQYQL